MRKLPMRFAACGAALLVALCPLAAAADAASDQAGTAAYLDTVRLEPARLAAFIAAMPKGADLHNHATGAVYAEDYLAWARQDDGCYDPATLALAPKPCPPSMRPLTQGIAEDPNLAKRVVEALSMADFWPTSANAGHDHFFGAFGLFGAIAGTHYSDVLAAATQDAAGSRARVLELMVSAGSADVNTLASQLAPVFSADDLAADSALLDRTGFAHAVEAAREEMRVMEAGRRGAMHCDVAGVRPGCDVDVHYLLQITRIAPPAHVFAQARVAFALAADPATHVVGINLVAPEDDPVAIRDYDLHMRIVRFLHAQYPSVHITLHAGELTPAIAPAAALRDHIHEAVEVAGAERIG
ncbi:MAG: adenosine deaminase, partial [Candidatus Eremiobacteraeota bacterium]|nr:adenosine deaminase [Candidatus Eremiobacteraeota bacterium]